MSKILICFLIVMLSLAQCSCVYIGQLLDPNLKILARYGGATIPNVAGNITFVYEMDDDKFAQAFQYLEKEDPAELQLDRSEISDLSISLLIQLKHLEVLRVEDTNVSFAGLQRLKLCSRLKQLYINIHTFTPVQNEILRKNLGSIEVIFDYAPLRRRSP